MPLPLATDFTGSSVTEGGFKTAMTNLIAYLNNLQTIPVGAVAHFAANSVPTGWVKANGAALSRTTYAALFAAIGTTYGAGDGSTTFNIPDLRGEFLRGWDNARGVDSGRVFGSAQGSANLSHTHSTDSQGAHTHSVPIAWSSSNYKHPSNQTESGNVHAAGTSGSAGAHTHTALASGDTEARPRNIAMLACIKF